MTKRREGPTGPADPFEVWRKAYEANDRAWRTTMDEAAAHAGPDTPGGVMLETFLAAQRSMRESLQSFVDAMDVARREDIAELADLLAGLDAKVDRLQDSIARLKAPEQRATRKASDGPARPTRSTTKSTGKPRRPG